MILSQFCNIKLTLQVEKLQIVMQYQYYKNTNNVEQTPIDRGFKKTALNVTFGSIPQSESEIKNVPRYTYQPLDLNFAVDKHGFLSGQQVKIQSPKSLTSFAKINFNQRATSSIDPRPTYPIQQSDKTRIKYTDFRFEKKKSDPMSVQTELSKTAPEQLASQALFSKYSRSENGEFNRLKSSSQFLPKEETFNFISSNRQAFNNPDMSGKQNYTQKHGEQNSEVQQYKRKIISLEAELSQANFEKSELIIQLAELQRQNSDMKRQLRRIEESSKSSISAPDTPRGQSRKIEIQEDLFYEIQRISQQQNEINKIKEEYIKLASAGYENEIKKLVQQNNSLKLEVQSLKVELEMAKQDLNEKQLKIDFLQRETSTLEQKSFSSSRMSVESMSESSNQVITLRHNLNALENRYRALSKQLASKEDYILKYITNRKKSQDLQAIKGLVIEDESFSSSQVNPFQLDHSKQQ